jgi:uncharacterized protein with FMN-binding domain
MPRRLVALSASAVAAVYFAGYLVTGAADAGLSGSVAPTATTISAPARAAPGSGPTPVLAQRPATAAPSRPTTTTLSRAPTVAPPRSPAAAPTSPPAAGAAYRDGTYDGTGTSRRGDVSVEVTIAGGRISDVAITDVTTQYSVRRIAALPGQVVARQSARVDRVTGATYSAQAFQQAVQQALAQAGHA